MRWNGCNRFAKRLSVHVNDSDSRDAAPRSATNNRRPGFDAQADGFATLRDGLDQYIKRMDSAHATHEKSCKTATANRDRLIANADKKHAETLDAIESRESEARTQIDEKYGSKLGEIKLEHEKSIQGNRSKYNRGVERAKKEREESLWMADAIHESSLRKADNEHSTVQKQLSEFAQSIKEQTAQLMLVLGPSNASDVVEATQSDPGFPDDPTQDGLAELIQMSADALSEIKDGGIRKILQGKTKKLELGIKASNLIIEAQFYLQSLQSVTADRHAQRLGQIEDARRTEIQRADQRCREAVHGLDTKAGDIAKSEHEQFNSRFQEVQSRKELDDSEIESWHAKQLGDAHRKHTETTERATIECSDFTEDASETYTAELVAGRARILESTGIAIGLLNATQDQTVDTNPDWAEAVESDHPTSVPGVISMGHARLNLGPRLDLLGESIRAELALPPVLETPLVWSLPGRRSLMVRHDTSGREQALATIRNTILRILSSFPAGKVRFMLADPIGIGQSFAEFMTLSDQEPSPVGQRIWSEPQQIERQLTDITEHMQTVIQKYLRADYETIEDYNIAAGEISEPYRFVVIADLPEALTETGAARLKSILDSGPRCGVYAILSAAASEKLPPNLDLDSLQTHTVQLAINSGSIAILDDRFDETVITLHQEPDDRVSAQLLKHVAQAGLQAGTVEVPFARLTPDAEEIWSRSCDDELVIPIGRSGAHKNQELRLGLGTRQHALIAGRTGSGKSTLLHVIVSAAMLWHSPDELEIYLIDFKKGVEFKAYTGDQVPHVRAVAIESDREFGLSVLKRLDDELTSRGDLFRKIGAQNLASARSMAPDERLPRVLLLIDEFQEFFTEDDDVASEATLLLDRLVRQGRAFGVHVILGSQTLAGSYSLARSTLGQIGIRIALQCSEADSYLILGEDNNAARLLERPGEAIYNNAGGLIEGNSPFQTAWLSDAERDSSLAKMPSDIGTRPATVVFEGNRPAQFDLSAESFAQAFSDRKTPRVLLGDAVAIAPPTSAPLLKRSGSNLLIVGQQPEPSLGMLVSSAITAAFSPRTRLIVIDPTPEDDAIHGRIASAVESSGLNARIVNQQEADDVVAELSKLVQERGEVAGDPVILVLAGLHRLRSLRKSDDYSFSMDESKASPDKDLLNILREGPAAGVWTLAWCDTLSNVERAMERSTIREFGLRALMQMSASDSASLIDTSIASTLGANRAILADDVEGTLQKFLPINLPDSAVVRRALEFLAIS